MINRSAHEKDKGFPNASVPKNRTEKQIIVGDFLTKHGRIPSKILKNCEQNFTDILQTLIASEYTFLKCHRALYKVDHIPRLSE